MRWAFFFEHKKSDRENQPVSKQTPGLIPLTMRDLLVLIFFNDFNKIVKSEYQNLSEIL
jgi:hypothetical protein|nr:MAG TPA: hypothetical protein [Caudoviricetes sp.]